MSAAGAPVPLLDVEVTPLTREQLLRRIDTAIVHGEALTIAGHNLHSVYLVHTDPQMARFYEQADLRLVDGMPVLAAHALGALRRRRLPRGPRHRLGSLDWVPQALDLPAVQRVLLIGGTSTSNAAAVRRLADHGGPQVLGIPGDPWHPEALEDVLESLRTHAPHLILIGMGMPLQEQVAEELRRAGAPGIIATVGGAVDQLSGAQTAAPRWIGRLGAEWLWRLAADPRRLSRRYLLEPVQLLRLLTRRAA